MFELRGRDSHKLKSWTRLPGSWESEVNRTCLEGTPACWGRGNPCPFPSLFVFLNSDPHFVSRCFVLKQPSGSCGCSRLAKQIACFLGTGQWSFRSTGRWLEQAGEWEGPQKGPQSGSPACANLRGTIPCGLWDALFPPIKRGHGATGQC